MHARRTVRQQQALEAIGFALGVKLAPGWLSSWARACQGVT
jgi:hypothetical protein